MTEERQPRETGMRDVPKRLRPYYLGLLRKGERWNETEGREASELLPQHLAFLREQIEQRTYLFAGPATEEGDVVGVLMIQAANLAAARALAESDPGVRAGRLQVELHPVLLPSLDGIQVSY